MSMADIHVSDHTDKVDGLLTDPVGQVTGSTAPSIGDSTSMQFVLKLLDAPGTVTIPPQLRTPELRFIILPFGVKGGRNEFGWNTTANYAWYDPRLVAHLANGGNYGLFPRRDSGIMVLDVDDEDGCRAAGLLGGLEGETFTVLTGGSRPEQRRFHVYVRSCPPLTGTRSLLTGDGSHVADLRAQTLGRATAYVVGANSLHPSGGRYLVVCDKPIKDIDGNVFAALLEPLTRRKKKKDQGASPTSHRIATPGSITERLQLRCSDFMIPLNAKLRGDEVEGEHPIHGSTTGSNLTLSPDNLWWCRRCQTGGGPLEALAVTERIIACHEAGPGCLAGHWGEVFDALRRRGYDPDSFGPADQVNGVRPGRDLSEVSGCRS